MSWLVAAATLVGSLPRRVASVLMASTLRQCLGSSPSRECCAMSPADKVTTAHFAVGRANVVSPLVHRAQFDVRRLRRCLRGALEKLNPTSRQYLSSTVLLRMIFASGKTQAIVGYYVAHRS